MSKEPKRSKWDRPGVEVEFVPSPMPNLDASGDSPTTRDEEDE